MADWTIPDEHEAYLGCYVWEARPSDKDRYCLAVSRSFVTNADVNQITLEHV